MRFTRVLTMANYAEQMQHVAVLYCMSPNASVLAEWQGKTGECGHFQTGKGDSESMAALYDGIEPTLVKLGFETVREYTVPATGSDSDQLRRLPGVLNDKIKIGNQKHTVAAGLAATIKTISEKLLEEIKAKAVAARKKKDEELARKALQASAEELVSSTLYGDSTLLRQPSSPPPPKEKITTRDSRRGLFA